MNREIVPSLIALLNNGCLFGNHFPISNHLPVDWPSRVPFYSVHSVVHSFFFLSLSGDLSGDSSDAIVILITEEAGVVFETFCFLIHLSLREKMSTVLELIQFVKVYAKYAS